MHPSELSPYTVYGRIYMVHITDHLTNKNQGTEALKGVFYLLYLVVISCFHKITSGGESGKLHSSTTQTCKIHRRCIWTPKIVKHILLCYLEYSLSSEHRFDAKKYISILTKIMHFYKIIKCITYSLGLLWNLFC